MGKLRYTPRTYINGLCRSVFEYKCELGYFDFGDDSYPAAMTIVFVQMLWLSRNFVNIDWD